MRFAGFALSVLALALSQTGCEKEKVEFREQVKPGGEEYRTWEIDFYKDDEDVMDIQVFDPDGVEWDPANPGLPFSFDPKDGTVTANRPGTFSAPDRARRLAAPLATTSSVPGYVWILSDYPTNAVYVFDPATAKSVASIALPGVEPLGIGSNRAGTFVYATIQSVPQGLTGISAGPATVQVISAASLSITGVINLPQGVNPGKPIISLDDRYLYIPATATNQTEVLVVDTQNPSAIVTIPLSSEFADPTTAALTPDGALLFVLSSNTVPGQVFVVDTAAQGQIAVINTSQGSLFDVALTDIAIDPTGSRLYLIGNTSVGPLNQRTGYLLVYDTASLAQITNILVQPSGFLNNMAMTAGGGTIFANDQFSGNQFAIDLPSLAVTALPSNPLPSPPDSSLTLVVP